MIYTSYAKPKFFVPIELCRIKMQIDNLLRIGWERDNILLATNFEFSYRGVKSRIIPDELIYFKHNRRSAMFAAKIDSLKYILENWIEDNESIFFHDLDAHQNVDNIEAPTHFYDSDMCLTPYNYDDKKINTGVWHLNPRNNTINILNDVISAIKKMGRNWQEQRLTEICKNKEYKSIFILGCEWNFGKHDVKGTLERINISPYFCHFKENEEKYMQHFRDILNPNLLEIIEKHVDK